MIDHFVVGGFYRVHTGRGSDENLNSPGMHFVPLAFDETCLTPDRSANPDAAPNRFYAYGVVARLAMLAASIELDEALRNRGRMKLLFIVDPLASLKALQGQFGGDDARGRAPRPCRLRNRSTPLLYPGRLRPRRLRCA